MNYSQLAKIMGGEILQMVENRKIESLLIDSRKAVISESALFFALQGPRHDGHQFVETLYRQGIRQFVVQKWEGTLRDFPDANIIIVPNSLRAMQALVAKHRAQFGIPIIAVTGSNGKTVVKEWLHEALSKRWVVCSSPKSYNSQVGVPLSVWALNERHQIGLFEAGISLTGEMKRLQAIIQPTLGIFTNIGSAHAAGFESQEQKVREKLMLFQEVEALVYCKDHQLIDKQVKSFLKDSKLLAWSTEHQAPYRYKIVGKEKGQTIVKVNEQDLLFLPFVDEASLENTFHILTVLQFLEYSMEDIQRIVKQFKAPSMRLELKRGVQENYIIDDTYNNDLLGLEMALDFLVQQNQRPVKRVILSDIAQSGMSEEELYQQVNRLLSDRRITHFVGIGSQISAYQSAFQGIEATFFPDTESFLRSLEHQIPWQEELILVKGARHFGFEQVVRELEAKVHGTRLELSLDAMAENLNFYRSLLKPKTKLMVMVKAFAYGSGNLEVAQLLQYHRVDYLGVAFPDEGVELRKNGIHLPIMVMNCHEDTFEALVRYQLEPEVFGFGQLKAFGEFLRANGKQSSIHLKIDSGMHRLGFMPAEIPTLIEQLKNYPELKVKGIFSHLSGADEAEFNDFSHEQAGRFQEAVSLLKAELNIDPLCHLCNSAGIVRFPEYHFDMVRLGIGLHGVEVTGKYDQALKVPARLKTFISQIKEIPAGETVGYSRKGKVEATKKIATIAIGYADGFQRAFGNGRVKVKINGQRVPIIGNVCMDMCMVDVTGVAAKEGDEVILFDDQESLLALSEAAGTIPYEVLTLISNRVKRVYFHE
ncbi:bifunctional UDP-N-acetylmuramoyl-tripeptide:D-alanyl-D-alanine ligase/alanine racemase [Persicobacter sp. CCB-QB2]|uniref:bifunctional UDP-N-acetylmuramoyl-tripeptide:D-alanyl-D-alanine ligase/alanine racemase n=1 Tax=Persicobacter sp. CCB-QB2 TaxID=1561025 RepID=UPI00092EFAA6|nr:bifunctional UDP-N-acetylmuramoyl-tripeptide:D-alanyl-D-alanine ligase/alanine racemase [Persicobacter sp. CCB-QB2]